MRVREEWGWGEGDKGVERGWRGIRGWSGGGWGEGGRRGGGGGWVGGWVEGEG